MLIITRKNGQKIMINDNIEITIVEARNGTCKVAIQADRSVKIYREEIYLQIKLANLMGTSANISATDSVSKMIRNGSDLNNRTIDTAPATEEEVLMQDKKPRTIKVYRKHEGS